MNTHDRSMPTDPPAFPVPAVPWLAAAQAALPRLTTDQAPQALSGPTLTRTLAIQWAQGDIERPRTVSQFKPESLLRKDREGVKALFDHEVASLRRAPDAALKLGAAHALAQLLERIHGETGAEPGVAEVQRALCAPTDHPPALMCDDDPGAERLEGRWVGKVRATLSDWAQRLGSLFAPGPWEGDAWNHAWANAAALTELDRWLNLARCNVQGEDPQRWRRVITTLLNPERPQAKYSPAHRGALTCLPTDKASALKVRLQLSPWLAEALSPGQGQAIAPIPYGAPVLHALRFRVSGLGDMSNSDVFRSNGLRVDHLYVSIFIQRLGQTLRPAAPPPMNIPHSVPWAKPPQEPPADLPAELHEALDPGEWSAALAGIAQWQECALAAHRAHAAGQTVRPMDAAAQRQPRLRTRRAAPTLAVEQLLPPLRALPAELLAWHAPPDPDHPGLGSIWLSPAALNPARPPQYTDCCVLVQRQGRWYAIRPELWDEADEEGDVDQDSERVALNAYAPLPPVLRAAGGWPRLAKAMPQAAWVVHFWGQGLLLLAALSLDGEQQR